MTFNISLLEMRTKVNSDIRKFNSTFKCLRRTQQKQKQLLSDSAHNPSIHNAISNNEVSSKHLHSNCHNHYPW